MRIIEASATFIDPVTKRGSLGPAQSLTFGQNMSWAPRVQVPSPVFHPYPFLPVRFVNKSVFLKFSKINVFRSTFIFYIKESGVLISTYV